MKTGHADPVLPPELLMEILSWLSVKNLMRLRCVSKSWKSLISDDKAFTKLHLKKSPENTHVLLSFEDVVLDRSYIVSFPVGRFLDKLYSVTYENCYCLWKSTMVVGSCNGLVCLCGYLCVGGVQQFFVRLWNPTTHLKSEMSPTLPRDISHMRTWVFDPWDKVNRGFGYDESRDTYKAVMALCHSIEPEPKMETTVYCMGDSCWRKISSSPSSSVLLQQFDGQFVGGCVNWLALDNLNGPNYEWQSVTLDQLVIVCFHMREEAYTYLSLPEGVSL
ncbi:F-box/kelch-repeat protein At3g23880-like [Lotus japonicus]|uniref:F-box/kelch-repeat protein At3g23880-like n=1 Tax=Lotus japonicus TaxID=34305 RepID=UPI00258CF41D|nr:F-box/kelch-repeat protein At3g23880-like [Lotus japonicus]